MSDKTKTNIDLGLIKESSDWDTVTDINVDTLKDIQTQMGLVQELRVQGKDKLTPELDIAFDGLLLSFKDLIKETLTVGTEHALKTGVTKDDLGNDIVYAEQFLTGDITDDDQAMLYINVASKYMNIQDKTINLISFGWVDLFTKLKMPVDELSGSIKEGLTNIKEAHNGQ